MHVSWYIRHNPHNVWGGHLKYPDDFDVPAFPAGRSVAVVRAVSVAVMVVFLVIAFLCGLLFWTQRSVKIHPFLVSINSITGQWDVVGHQHKEMAELSVDRALQESVIGKFLRSWFQISHDEELNHARWESCDRATECTISGNASSLTNKCGIYCVAEDGLYLQFITQIVPRYQTRVANGEVWEIDMASLQITPIGAVSAAGGMWQIRANILSNIS